jgi:hydroxymethylglutaryl-CoA lyase
MAQHVEVIDVAPRDGLQNERNPVSTGQKLGLIEKLVGAGVTAIQATSFVDPKRVPQMADAETVAQGLSRFPGVRFSALILNFKGYERAVASGFRQIDFVVAVSDTFNRRNANRSVAESLQILDQVSRAAARDDVAVCIGIATSFHCPFEGRISAAQLARVVKSAREHGPWRVGVADTTGMAFPDQIEQSIVVLGKEAGVAPAEIILHFHDTYGRGLSNTLAGIKAGVRAFETAVGGLGGCPFCPGATGNLATEDLVAFVEGLGYSTGINMEKLLDAAETANGFTAVPYQGHLLRALRHGAVARAKPAEVSAPVGGGR